MDDRCGIGLRIWNTHYTIASTVLFFDYFQNNFKIVFNYLLWNRLNPIVNVKNRYFMLKIKFETNQYREVFNIKTLPKK